MRGGPYTLTVNSFEGVFIYTKDIYIHDIVTLKKNEYFIKVNMMPTLII